MSDEPDAITASDIAAAKLKVAIADRAGEGVPGWIRELASRDLRSVAPAQGHEQDAAQTGPPPVASGSPVQSAPIRPLDDATSRMAESSREEDAIVNEDQGRNVGTRILKRGVRVTEADRTRLASELQKRYNAGESIRSLAASTGRSYGFVYRILKESGVPVRGKFGKRGRGRR